ncbi:hypothetical protein [Actinocrispum wychmicini]|uniref:Uncharacterized protein n=1 Tax=Actinocrispum wychmicini TaxID=1213861 RepID=A0A4R2JY86_9PSEU|nr:hypothetical protein [Actinocrispum wychmicini]TCO64267.1 hypothetical protein EV192_10132 [Actinocrispum wychmicini]
MTDLDGTQALPPLSFLPDPLAGLVTGDSWSGQEPRVAAPKPVALPDPAEIRAVLEEPPRRRPRRPSPMVKPSPTITAPLRPWPSPVAMARVLRATRDRLPTPKVANQSTSSRTGIRVVLLILLVTAVILVYVVRSLADTLSQLFG